MTYKNIIISLFIVLAAGLAIWTSLLSFRPRSTTAITPISQPDAFMEEVNALILDKQGKPSMRIVTPKMVHYAENDTTYFNEPQLTLYRKSPQPWYISAKFATAAHGMDQVLFEKNVTIHHSADQNNPATLIKTAHLLVHPNQKTAETSDEITMTQPNIIVRAIGMFADMNSGDIKLLSGTRGEYVPSN